MIFSKEEVLKVTGGKLWRGKPGGGFTGVALDSRQIGPGELFFPLAGENFNGHDFIVNALQGGAAGSLLEEAWLPSFAAGDFPAGKTIIVVENTLLSLQKLAAYHRAKFSLPVLAVTGSNGKTTTKDFIASVLSTRYNVLKTEGNLNNHLGLPLMLLRFKKEHEVAVLELGMSGPGEIALLTDLCRPTKGVITNIGEAHLGFLGSRENIAWAKGELLAGLNSRGKAFLNGDDPFLVQMGEKFAGEVFYYGFTAGFGIGLQALGYTPTARGCSFEVALPGGVRDNFAISLPGKHNVYNALAALAVGLDFSLTNEQIKKGLATCIFSAMRMEKTLTQKGLWVINDAYNASPTSMRYALQSLREWAPDRPKIAVLGDMYELGPQAGELHCAVGRYLADLGIDYLLTVGKLAASIAHGACEAGMVPENIFMLGTPEEALSCLHELARPGFYILIKGSRAMQLEKIAEELINRY